MRQPLFTSAARRWAIGIALACALLAVLVVFIRFLLRRRRAVGAAEHRYDWPDRVTPFTAVVLLKRMYGDAGLALSPEQKAALARAIEDLQHDHFARPEPTGRIELQRLLDQWLAVAGNGRESGNTSKPDWRRPH